MLEVFERGFHETRYKNEEAYKELFRILSVYYKSELTDSLTIEKDEISIDRLKYPRICEAILHYKRNKNSKEVYDRLINLIFSNPDIRDTMYYNEDYTYKESIVTIFMKTYPSYPFNKDQKGIIEDFCDKSVDKENISYLMISSPNWTDDEKKELIYIYYSDEDWNQLLDREIDNIMVYANMHGYTLDRDSLGKYTFDKIAEQGESYENAKIMWDMISKFNKFTSLRSYNYDIDDLENIPYVDELYEQLYKTSTKNESDEKIKKKGKYE